MQPNGNDPLEFAKKLAESYRGVKFGTGVVGKTAYAMLALFSIWGIVLWRLTGNLWPDLALFAGGLMASGMCWWWVRSTQNFATRNPGLAMLEGAQFLEYQKWEAEVKGLPPLKGPRIIDPHASLPRQDNEKGPKAK